MADKFSRFASRIAVLCGHYLVFLAAFFLVVVWCVGGLVFGFTDTYQLIINTSTTIVTFLMVFLIQNTQNRDSLAMHLKLDEIILKMENADNRFIHSENVSNERLEQFKQELDDEISRTGTPPILQS